MRWQKLGRIFETRGELPWATSHAALPIVEHIGGSLFRVYYSARDSQNRAQIGAFDFDLAQPFVTLHVTTQPIISLGTLGAFDDNGVTGACLVNHEEKTYLYYTGWTLGVTVPFYFYVGLAVRDTRNGPFERVSIAPILERSAVDPYLTASPCVLVEDGLWRMWYVSCSGWMIENGAPKHYYHVRYAESEDGIHWKREGLVCITYASQDEYAFARPVVIRDSGLYRMWYSYRGPSYRMGYAESLDGLTWLRKDNEVGIAVSEVGWDSEMVAYGQVFEHDSTKYMLYNGNGYGKTGIGLAVAVT